MSATVSNIGNGPLTLTGSGIFSPNFTEQPVTGSSLGECAGNLAGGETCLLTAVFTPAATPGEVTYNFPLIDNALNAPGSTQSILFDGTGVAAPQTTTLTLTASPGSSVVGKTVTLTATLKPFTADGVSTDGETVTFLLGGEMLGTGQLANGVATYQTVALPIGSDSLSASYPGDGTFQPSTSPTLTYTVHALSASTSTTLAISANTVAAGTPATLTATVVSNVIGNFNGPLPISPGLVKFCDATAELCENSALIGTAQLTTAGTAALKFVPGIGVHIYRAVFAGTYGSTTSASGTLTLRVTGIAGGSPTTTTIAASGAAGDYTLTATTVGNVSSASGAAGPSGTVSFQNTTHGSLEVATAALGAGTLVQAFVAEVPIPTGTNPQSVAVGDFNGDGIPDLAVANFSSATVSVVLRNADGSVRAPAIYETGGGPQSVTVDDVNGDGFLDLVVTNATDGTVGVLLGNGDGTFNPQVAYATGGTPTFVAVGDFNGDGVPDLAVANEGQGSGETVSVLLGNGDGTFGTQVTYGTGNEPNSVAVGDFNGDGFLDLAIANIGSNTVSVLLGKGDGTFQAQITYPTGNQPFSVTAGDFRGTGVLDLAVANNVDNTVSVLTGNGDGTFNPQVAYNVGTNPRTVVTGDLNGDGIPDLATSDSNSNTVSVLLGKGDGTFNARPILPGERLSGWRLATSMATASLISPRPTRRTTRFRCC